MLQQQDVCTYAERRRERMLRLQGEQLQLHEPPGICKKSSIDKIRYRNGHIFSDNGKIAEIKPNGNVHIYNARMINFMIINHSAIKLKRLYRIHYNEYMFINRFLKALSLDARLKIKHGYVFIRMNDTLQHVSHSQCAIIHNIKPFVFELKNRTFSQLYAHEKQKLVYQCFRHLDDLCIEKIMEHCQQGQ